MNNHDYYNSIAIFRRPLRINGESLYGILYDEDKIEQYENDTTNLDEYMCYLTAAESFLHNQGSINLKGDRWVLPDGYTVECKSPGFTSLLLTLFKCYTKYSILKLDEPIDNSHFSSNEVDGCHIINISVMEKYVFPNKDKIIDMY